MPHKTSSKGRVGHYVAKEATTLVECLVQHFGLTTEEGERLVSFGSVYQDRQRVDSDRALSPGQYIRVHLNPKRFPVEGIDWATTIVHRDKAFVVVNKPAGIPVHATLDNQVENLLHQLRVALGGALYVTQRLDTDVSGLIVVARTQEFQRQFNRLLADRKLKKRYRALVTTAPEVGRHIHYMEPSERSPKTIASEARPGWQECALRVVKVEPASCAVPAPGAFDVEIDLETGRTHQIRAQLSAIGSPIVGDTMYGSRTPYKVNGTRLPGIGLFSASNSWISPEGREWAFALSPQWMG
nr:pseudouridine synthase [uncultured bacterium]